MNLNENQFRGICESCGGTVKPGEGYVTGKSSKKGWIVEHKDCPVSASANEDARLDYEEDKNSNSAYKYDGDIDRDYHGEQGS